MKYPPDEKQTGQERRPPRTDQAWEVVEQYANDLREIIKKLSKKQLN